MEYRQAELRLEQLYTQIRMQVVNAKFALTNDRANVQASLAARDYNQQSLDAEVKKLRLGASTTANVLLQERNLAAAEDNLIAAHAAVCQGPRRTLPGSCGYVAALRHQPARSGVRRYQDHARGSWSAACSAGQGALDGPAGRQVASARHAEKCPAMCRAFLLREFGRGPLGTALSLRNQVK